MKRLRLLAVLAAVSLVSASGSAWADLAGTALSNDPLDFRFDEFGEGNYRLSTINDDGTVTIGPWQFNPGSLLADNTPGGIVGVPVLTYLSPDPRQHGRRRLLRAGDR